MAGAWVRTEAERRCRRFGPPSCRRLWRWIVVEAALTAGARAVAKVFELLLATIGLMLVRRGLELTLQEAQHELPRIWGRS